MLTAIQMYIFLLLFIVTKKKISKLIFQIGNSFKCLTEYSQYFFMVLSYCTGTSIIYKI